jgi:hypothetical protein
MFITYEYDSLVCTLCIIFKSCSFFFQNYKPPGAKDIPIDILVVLRRNEPNPFGVLRSKGNKLVSQIIV